MFKCCNNPRAKVVSEHHDRWEDWSDTYTALVSCENCGVTKYVTNKTSSFCWALLCVFVFILVIVSWKI